MLDNYSISLAGYLVIVVIVAELSPPLMCGPCQSTTPSSTVTCKSASHPIATYVIRWHADEWGARPCKITCLICQSRHLQQPETLTLCRWRALLWCCIISPAAAPASTAEPLIHLPPPGWWACQPLSLPHAAVLAARQPLSLPHATVLAAHLPPSLPHAAVLAACMWWTLGAARATCCCP